MHEQLSSGGLCGLSGADRVSDGAGFFECNLDESRRLLEDYNANIRFILSELPDVNWNSPKQVKEYFNLTFDLGLKSSKIAELEEQLARFHEEEEVWQILWGVKQYLKLRFTIKNYLEPIIKYEGRVPLRVHEGRIVFPNKQNSPTSPDILGLRIPNEQD